MCFGYNIQVYKHVPYNPHKLLQWQWNGTGNFKANGCKFHNLLKSFCYVAVKSEASSTQTEKDIKKN